MRRRCFHYPLYAIQHATIFMKAVRVIWRNGVDTMKYVLPHSLTSVAYEIDYRFGKLLYDRRSCGLF